MCISNEYTVEINLSFCLSNYYLLLIYCMNVLTTKEELYKFYLYEINDIKFTVREIDIISCVVHNRGNKKIVGLLSRTSVKNNGIRLII